MILLLIIVDLILSLILSLRSQVLIAKQNDKNNESEILKLTLNQEKNGRWSPIKIKSSQKK